MTTQTTYANRMSAGYEGQIADQRLKNVITALCEDATLAAGLAVIQGTADSECKVGAAGVFLGITVRDPTLAPNRTVADQDKYKAGDNVNVLDFGPVWVKTLAICTAGAPVYRTAAGAITPTSTSNTLIANARFLDSGAADAIVRISLK